MVREDKPKGKKRWLRIIIRALEISANLATVLSVIQSMMKK